MAGKLYPVNGEQYRTVSRRLREIMRQVDQKGGSPLDPDWVAGQLQLIIEPRGLILGMFATPMSQLACVRVISDQLGLGLDEEDFVQLGPPPLVPAGSGPLTVVILDIVLASTKQTFETAWKLAASLHTFSRRSKAMRESDSAYLRLLCGPRVPGLCWRIVDLGANRGRCPLDVRSASLSPDSAILWMAYYSPKWAKAMNGLDVPFVYLPGYEVYMVNHLHDWRGMPTLSGHRELVLDVGRNDHPGTPFFATPAFVE